MIKHGHARRYGRASPEYWCWSNIIQRCENPKNCNYAPYGARGIRVCEEWKNFSAFLNDVGHRPTSKHMIERIDNNGNYEPGNVKWALRSEQMRNTRSNVLIAYGGKVQCLKDWSRELKIPFSTLRRRVSCGWSITDAFNIPPRIGKLQDGEVVNIFALKGHASSRRVARQYGVGHRTVLEIWRRNSYAHLTG